MICDSKKNQDIGESKSFRSWLRSAFIACVLALILTIWVVPAIFGIVYRDPASVWIFAGMMDFLIGCALLPVLVTAHALIYQFFKVYAEALAIVVGLLVHLFSVCITWYLFYGWQPVLRAA